MSSRPSDYNLPMHEWRPYQLDTVRWAENVTPGKVKITENPTGCHAKGQGILMYDGSIKKVEDIVFGDQVMGDDWTARTVLQLFSGRAQIYEVKLDDGHSFTVTRDHVLVVMDLRPNYTRTYYDLEISVEDWKKHEKQDWLVAIYKPQKYRNDIRLSNMTIEPLIGNGQYFGFMLDGNHRYLLDNQIVTRNSGKSAIAMAQSNGNRNVIVLTATKSLQLQYGQDRYDAKVLFGKANYACLHKLMPYSATAEDCRYPKDMERCETCQSGLCDYYNAKQIAKASQRVVFNYALWFAARDGWYPNYLIMDEAHKVSEMVLDHVGFELAEQTRERLELPQLPVIVEPSGFIGFSYNRVNNLELMLDWIEETRDILFKRFEAMKINKSTSEANLRKMRVVRSYLNKMEVMRGVLTSANLDHWFMRSGPSGLNGKPGMLCKPITARYHAPDYFKIGRMLYMSATIGDVPTFATELGIVDYEFRGVESVWPITTRPVYVLDVPSMGKSATQKDPLAFDKQADEIAKAILACPRDWSGFVLVTRKAEAALLAERLAIRGLADRVWVTPGADEPTPTDQQLAAWQNRKNKVSNSICISWSFWEGVNGRQEKICIVAKAPYVMESEYERARRSFDHSMYLQRAAYTLEQGLGRTRRGNPDDYDDPDKDIQRGLVCIADASWKPLRHYMSKAIKDAIIEV